MLVFIQEFFCVYKIVGHGHRWYERARRIFKIENNGRIVWCRNTVNHKEIGLTCTQNAFWRFNDPVEAGLDVPGCELGAIMKFDVVTDFESKSLAAICWLRDVTDAEVAFEVGGRCRIGGIDPDQNAIVLRKRVYRPESCFSVSVGCLLYTSPSPRDRG